MSKIMKKILAVFLTVAVLFVVGCEDSPLRYNGTADELLAEIIESYEAEDWYHITSLYNKMHYTFPGTYQETQAKEILDESDKHIAYEREHPEERVRSRIQITELYCSEPREAGAVDVYCYWVNKSDKVIDAIIVDVIPCDADDQPLTMESESITSLGPFKKGEGNKNKYWENVWYDSNIDHIQLKSIWISYVDGTTESFYSDAEYALY